MALLSGRQQMRDNLRTHCVFDTLLDGTIPDYDEFLEERRRLMAQKIKAWFEMLSR